MFLCWYFRQQHKTRRGIQLLGTTRCDWCTRKRNEKSSYSRPSKLRKTWPGVTLLTQPEKPVVVGEVQFVYRVCHGGSDPDFQRWLTFRCCRKAPEDHESILWSIVRNSGASVSRPVLTHARDVGSVNSDKGNTPHRLWLLRR